ncbi:pre-toxin TG domain-containing protein [Microbulbifer sp. MLAF003]|uniref:pre-toxin TG domain-containing protein n=1 Tax=unclassified Microbulbifer TaxID=2619833 RepID=UPI0024AD0D2F|nr:pre-toxin TG domain-containing protein [Microbulbifer sp. MLAF003]WHI53284.1 pre-toxin TG domain-containing protein [Microbulbifer sp. MLAF003]
MPITGSSNVACDSCHPTSNFEFDGSGVDAGASLIADLFPGVGSAKSLGQVFTGTDLITGEPVNRWLEGGGILLGMVPFGKTLTKGDKMVDLYRAVGPDEYHSLITMRGKFEFGPNGSEMKQFGMSFDEVLKYANTNPEYAAILRVTVQKNSLKQFHFSKGKIDPFIFKGGVVTVNGQK